jgi:hypothetical protein
LASVKAPISELILVIMGFTCSKADFHPEHLSATLGTADNKESEKLFSCHLSTSNRLIPLSVSELVNYDFSALHNALCSVLVAGVCGEAIIWLCTSWVSNQELPHRSEIATPLQSLLEKMEQ